MGFWSLFSTRAKENEIKDVVKSIVHLARYHPDRFFILYLEEYKEAKRNNDVDKCFIILHDLFSRHLERSGVFEKEFHFINNNDNVKNLIDLEVRRIFDNLKIPKERHFHSFYELSNIMHVMCVKYEKYPHDFFLTLQRVKYLCSEDEIGKNSVIDETFESILRYYGVSEREMSYIKNSPNLSNIYMDCVKRLIVKLKK